MDELLNALLYYSRLGRTDLRREPVDLRAAVLRALEVAGPRLRGGRGRGGAARARRRWSPPTRCCSTRCWSTCWSTRRSTPGPTGRPVVVGASVASGRRRGRPLFVRDNGIGMPAAPARAGIPAVPPAAPGRRTAGRLGRRAGHRAPHRRTARRSGLGRGLPRRRHHDLGDVPGDGPATASSPGSGCSTVWNSAKLIGLKM